MKPLFKLWPYIRPYRKTFYLIIVLGTVMGATMVSVVPLVQRLFDDVFAKKDATLLWIVPVGIVCLYTVNGFARFFHLYLLKMLGEKIAAQIRQDLQSKFMNLNLTFHNNYNAGTGGLLSRTINDVVVVQWGINIIADMIREPITALFLLAAIFHLDWKLAVFSFTVAPLIFVALKQLARSVRKYAFTQQETMEDFTSTLKETLDGIRVIQSFGLESEMRRRLQEVVDRYLFNRRKILIREEAAGPISEVLTSIILAAIIFYMAREIFAGRSSPGTFIAFITALGMFQQPVKKIQDAYIRIQQTITAIERLFEILDDKNVVPESKGQLAFPKTWDKIRFENVSFSYDTTTVLNSVNFDVACGQTVALVGESGSGKSSLVNLLERFFDPDTGSILVGNTPIREISLKELRKNIALVTQDVFLFNESIERNILAGDFDRVDGSAQEAARTANAHEFINRIPEQYESRVGDRGARLSGGERQRISIARALFKDAPILILDEATSALDSASEVEVQKGLETLMKGRTTFVIAHRLSTVIKADLILVLKNGEIVQRGTHESLMASPGPYSKFVELQSRF